MDNMCSVFIEPPTDFNPSVVAVGCYCEFEDKILLLKRSPHKALGNTWGVPAGKLEENESAGSALIRELYEEVGLALKEEELENIGMVFVRRSSVDVALHLFRKRFKTLPRIKLKGKEHSETMWVTIDEALQLPQSTGGVKALKFYKTQRLMG